MKENYNYRDILLQPNYSEINSRSEINTSLIFGKFQFKLPIVPANMKTVIDEELSIWLAQNGYFYIMHRFDLDIVKFSQNMKKKGLYISISLGVNKDSYKIIESLSSLKIQPDYITIDIAHGHCQKMKNMLKFLKEKFKDTFIIAGNVCTQTGVKALECWGANSVKIGIGPGSVCSTKLKTGFSKPQFSAVQECNEIAKTPVIADGGIEHNGDIAKSLVAGADMVMVGGMLAGYDESPGETIIRLENDVEVYCKKYFGSASEHNKKEKKNIEGRQILIPLKGSIKDKYKEITQDLQSSVSYAGGQDLSAFKNVEYVVIH